MSNMQLIQLSFLSCLSSTNLTLKEFLAVLRESNVFRLFAFITWIQVDVLSMLDETEKKNSTDFCTCILLQLLLFIYILTFAYLTLEYFSEHKGGWTTVFYYWQLRDSGLGDPNRSANTPSVMLRTIHSVAHRVAVNSTCCCVLFKRSRTLKKTLKEENTTCYLPFR